MPRVAAALGFSGSLSITRKRYSSGHCMKSLARDGDSATGGRAGSPTCGSAPAVSTPDPPCPLCVPAPACSVLHPMPQNPTARH